MEKKMFALTFCYEGYDDCTPYACTIAVSEDKEKLIEKMNECVAEDTREPDGEDDEWDDDEWDDDINYNVYKNHKDAVYLQHRKITELYTSYKIHSVEVL